MKTRDVAEKKFDAVKMMRQIRDRIDKETEGMDFSQLKRYYKESAEENRKRSSR